MSNTKEIGPTKQEIEAVFTRLRAQPANKSCFDCGAKAPTWASVTYGVFICIDCSAVHRGLGVHLTFVRSTNLDTNWTWVQLRQMQLSGNANAAQFFRQHNCNTTDAQQKYNSRAAQLYRDKLAAQAQQAMKVHGTKLHLDNAATMEKAPVANAEVDFFAQCDNKVESDAFFENNNTDDGSLKQLDLQHSVKNENTPTSGGGAPTVDYLNSVVPTPAVQSTIGIRKIQPKRSNMGARKAGGLGATKVKANFAEIEQRATSLAAMEDGSHSKNQSSIEDLENSMSEMAITYQNLSMKKSQEEEKLKTIDPVKAKQMERLGMGFNLKSIDVSHSALSDMETIHQTVAPKSLATSNQSKLLAIDNDNFFNDFSPSMYNIGNTANSCSSGKSSKLDKQELEIMGFETIEPIVGPHHSNITTMFGGGGGSTASRLNSREANKSSSSQGRNKSSKSSSSNYEEDTAQKKFGSTKGFGSEQFFGDQNSPTSDVASNLSRFQGSNSISSADYFGGGTPSNGSSGQRGGYSSGVNFQTPDLDDVKESVRQGVHKVADRLSSLASDVMSSLQDKYGY